MTDLNLADKYIVLFFTIQTKEKEIGLRYKTNKKANMFIKIKHMDRQSKIC